MVGEKSKKNTITVALILATLISSVYSAIVILNPQNMSFGYSSDAIMILFSLHVLPALILWGLYLNRNRHASLNYLFILAFILYILVFVINVMGAPPYLCHGGGFLGSDHCHWFEFLHLH